MRLILQNNIPLLFVFTALQYHEPFFMRAKFLFGTSSHIPENYLLIITRHSFMGLIIIIVTILSYIFIRT